MPRFMDYHDDLQLPPEAIEQIAQGTRDGVSDQFGVRQIELYHNADGKVYCLLEGPDEDAIRQHHAALGVPCGDVHQVNSLTDRPGCRGHPGGNRRRRRPANKNGCGSSEVTARRGVLSHANWHMSRCT